MGRRSDHSRDELRTPILEGDRPIAEVGFGAFSAREVAKRIGHPIGAIHNVFGTIAASSTGIGVANEFAVQ